MRNCCFKPSNVRSLWFGNVILVLLLSFVCHRAGLIVQAAETTTNEASTKPGSGNPRIAVIGGGIGGTSATHFLRKSLGSSAVIDLYEPNVIGGRVGTINIDGRDYESGGSIIHPDNKYMVNFREEFGFKKSEGGNSLLSFYNGKEFVFTESKWAVVTLLRMLWRYGMDCFKIFSLVKSMLSSFSRIYQLQDNGETFNTPSELLDAMEKDTFVRWAHTPVQSVLHDLGYSDRFIDEFVSVAARVNYGQSTNITAFAGMVSVAGVMPGLWAVQGGNKQIPQALLKSSGAMWHHARVNTIKKTTGEETKFEVTATAPQTNQELTAEYDMVVVATPLTPGVGSNIEFQGFAPAISPFSGWYQRTVATFIHGQPNPEAFGKKPGDYLPDVLTTCNVSQKIRSLSENFQVDITEDNKNVDAVYKVFSSEQLTDERMNSLFVSRKSSKAIDWLAYPHYTENDDLPSFVLSDGVFYINGIEWAASAMEMSVIGARNCALLATKHWQHAKGIPSETQEIKTEVKREL
ncbi:prenylcysteine oxidase 1-like [Asterias amurensis]|uniref:prenylcysteine oxidase 1-like n=1 Tax=Asterias amurensis TaxID=7602 RepID=UPI003AB466BD